MRWKTPSERRQMIQSNSLRERIYKVIDFIESNEKHIDNLNDSPTSDFNSFGMHSLTSQINSPQATIDKDFNSVKPNIKITNDFQIEFVQNNSDKIDETTSEIVAENKYLRSLCKYQYKLIGKLKSLFILPPSKVLPVYNGDLSLIPGPWSAALINNPMAAINLFNLTLDILGSSIGFRKLTLITENDLRAGRKILDTMAMPFPEISYIYLWTKFFVEGKRSLQITDSLKKADLTVIPVSIHIHFEREINCMWAEFEPVNNLSPILFIDSKIIESKEIGKFNFRSTDPLYLEKMHSLLFEVLDENTEDLQDGSQTFLI